MRYDGIGYSGLVVSPYYDSLLVKYTARGASWEETVRRMRRALQEARIRGVKTNIPFLLNVLTHPEFEKGVTTSFIDQARPPHAAPPAPRASRPVPPASPLTPYPSLAPSTRTPISSRSRDRRGTSPRPTRTTRRRSAASSG